MIILEIIFGIGALTSIFMWLQDIRSHRRPLKELVYPGLVLVLAATAITLNALNMIAMSPTAQARILVESWPATVDYGDVNAARANGIVLAGLKYLETHKNLYPETYARHVQEYDSTDFQDWGQASHAADSMIAAIRSYAGVLVKPP